MSYQEFRSEQQIIISFDKMTIEMNNMPANQTLIIATLAGGMRGKVGILLKSQVKLTTITDSRSAYEVYDLMSDHSQDIISNLN